MMNYDYAIVGAGITGLTLARRLKSQHQTVLVLEKSRGAGGRLATRRWSDDGIFFDHGCEGLDTKSSEVEAWVKEMNLESLLKHEGDDFKILDHSSNSFCSGGISQIGRRLSEGLELQKQVKVHSIQRIDSMFRLQSDEGDVHLAQKVVFTCPLPQIKQIILNEDSDNIMSKLWDPVWDQVTYEPSHSVMSRVSSLEAFSGNLTKKLGEGFVAVNVSQKFRLKQPCVIVHSPTSWSSENLEEDPEQVYIRVKTLLIQHGLSPVGSYQVHRWRYALAGKVVRGGRGFAELCSGDLFFAGEAFAGTGVSAALRSANKLSDHLLFDTNGYGES